MEVSQCSYDSILFDICGPDMGDEDRGGLPNLDPDLSKNWAGLHDPDLSKNRGGLHDSQNFRGNSRKVEANLDSPRLLAKSRGELG